MGCYGKRLTEGIEIDMTNQVVDEALVNDFLPPRDVWSHKGNFGRILLLCGSRGYTGAAALAAMGALRSGAGVVYLGVPESIYAIEAVKLTEPVVFPLPDRDGMLASDAVKQILAMKDRMHAVLIGPGLGKSQGTRAVLEMVLREFECPVVVDADGINLLAGHKDILRGRQAPTILTPHDGEFLRLAGAFGADRQAAAVELASELECVVLLKGHRTLITDGKTCFENQTGNPGMATGGSGDVLAGIIVSLLGQGVPPLEAAAIGAHLHGICGDICAQRLGQYGMLPSDMLDILPRLLN